MLPEIVVHLIAAGEMCARANEHRHYQWRVDSKRRLIEAECQRRLEAARQERARLRRLEQARIDKLLQDAMSLRLATDIRAYVAAVSDRNADVADPVSDADMTRSAEHTSDLHSLMRKSSAVLSSQNKY